MDSSEKSVKVCYCFIKKAPAKSLASALFSVLSGYSDSNGGPPAPKAGALANCATPRLIVRCKYRLIFRIISVSFQN